MMTSTIKNNVKGSFSFTNLEDDFTILTGINETDETQYFTQSSQNNLIQFHFCVSGKAKFNFNKGDYSRELDENTALLLYNPQKALPIDLEISPDSQMVSLLISIQRFHQLFSEDASYIDFLKGDNRNKKYYHQLPISPNMAMVLLKIINFNLHSSVKKVYLKGKVYELLGLFFDKPQNIDVERCPFLRDEENVRKIKAAKEIMISNMTNPPTLRQLSKEIGLGLKKLKEGFKEIYGETVYGFLLNHKMMYAQQLLDSGKYNVNEVGLKIGYSTASHFISAFKKKFGTTPKKYTQSLNSN